MTSNELEKQALDLLALVYEQPLVSRDSFLKEKAKNHPALLERVNELLKMELIDEYSLHTGAARIQFHEPPMPSRAGAYKIVKRVGYGGMGAVYKGQRDTGDFEHTVAIKVIRPGILSDSLSERFANERQTLANLSHPNIARLYDGGQLEDKSPYIIMEFVEGEGILQWCKHQALGLRARLDIFATVCEAVAHAHQNLIIHRDITPANVMVDPHGTVKLIDFGIAKPNELEAESIVTTQNDAVHASLSYTPGYAAPERSYGAPASTLSDIYSLGKLLQDILHDFELEADLKAIIDMSINPLQDQRYASVDLILQDIKRFQQGRTVNAYAGGTQYRLVKNFRRHKLAVISLCAALISLTAGLITTSILYKNAETQKEIATQRFNDVRELADYMMFELYDEVADMPRSTAIRQRMADFSQRYIEDLGASARADLDLRLDAIEGWLRLGDIQGNARYANLGEVSAAISSYARAETRLAELSEQELNGWEARFLKNVVLRKQADMAIYKDLNMAKARDLGQQVSQTFEELTAIGSEEQSTLAISEHISALLMVADAQNKLNSPEQGLKTLEKAQALNEQISASIDYLNDVQRRWLLYAQPMITFRRAEALYGLGIKNKAKPTDPAAEPFASQSIENFKLAMRKFADLSSSYPGWRRLQRNQAIAPWLLGNVLSELKHFDEASRYLEIATVRAHDFAQSDTEDSEAEQLLTAILSTRAYFNAYALKSYEGIEQLRKLTKDAEARASARPDDPRARITSLVLLRPTADALYHQDRVNEACDSYQLAKQKFESVAEYMTLPADFINNDVASVEQQLIFCNTR